MTVNSSETIYCIQEVGDQKEEVEAYFPDFIGFTDCTEQQIPRPKNKKKRKLCYSGKIKKHTSVKNLYSSNQKGLSIHKTKLKQQGKRHNYRIYKKNYPDLPQDVTSMFDLAFLEREKTIQSNCHPYLSKRREIMS